MDDVIQTSVSGIQSLADNKSLTISATMQAPAQPFLGDKDRLVQVMTNILSNSIKFTPLGGRIVITTRQETAPMAQIVVSVTDTGVGIPANELDLVFKKFHRSGDILTNNTEGTGLGLAITRQIIAYHGGAIWAESALGRGTTLIFTLPLDKSWNTKGEHLTNSPLF